MTRKPKVTKKLKPKPVKKTKAPDPLALVRAAKPTLSSDAPPQFSVVEQKFCVLDVVGIRGLKDGELEAILEREGIQKKYDTWREAKAVVSKLSQVGGVKSVTVVSRKIKDVYSRGEMWCDGRCVSIDGGVSELVRRSKEERAHD